MKARLALCVALSSCSLLGQVVPSAPSVGSVVDNVGAGTSVVKAIADAKECSKKAELPVAYPEEVSIGGAIAINFAKRIGPAAIDLSPEVKDLQLPALLAKFANKKPQTMGTGPRTDLSVYLNTLGKGLASFSERPSIDWTFIVLDSDVPNAFSAPGGYVFITLGMLKKVENEAQLAGILAHEIGHVAGRHALKSYMQSKKVTCVSAAAGDVASNADVGAVIREILGPLSSQVGSLGFDASTLVQQFGSATFNPNALIGKAIKKLVEGVGNTIVKDGFGGDMEKEADVTATKLLIFAGYDSREYEKIIMTLPDGSFFSPHPYPKNRVPVIAATRKEFDSFANTKAPPVSPTIKAVAK